VLKTLGIILAAGKSTRLYPATLAVSKQILPVYDKPLIYYPLSVLMLAGIKQILIITNPHEKNIFETLFKNAKKELGIEITIATQAAPNGLPEAFLIADQHYDLKEFDNISLILGDNIFYGSGFTQILKQALYTPNAAQIFLQQVKDPSRFGVVEFNAQGTIEAIVEKPVEPKSNYAITGLYFFPNDVADKSKKLTFSERKELEMVDLIRMYHLEERLDVQRLLRGISWFDTGTSTSLLEAALFVKTIQDYQGFLVGSPHEVAYTNKWIKDSAIEQFTDSWKNKNDYGTYLTEMIKK